MFLNHLSSVITFFDYNWMLLDGTILVYFDISADGVLLLSQMDKASHDLHMDLRWLLANSVLNWGIFLFDDYFLDSRWLAESICAFKGLVVNLQRN